MKSAAAFRVVMFRHLVSFNSTARTDLLPPPGLPKTWEISDDLARVEPWRRTAIRHEDPDRSGVERRLRELPPTLR